MNKIGVEEKEGRGRGGGNDEGCTENERAGGERKNEVGEKENNQKEKGKYN